MAELERHTDREGWVKWAIEFMRRGIWLADLITVHGPHPGADFMWGEAEGWIDGSDNGGIFRFRTANGIHGIHDVRGVRITAESGDRAFPVLRSADLTLTARRWLLVARRTREKLRLNRERDFYRQ